MENKIQDIKLGDRVKVIGKHADGVVAFLGETHFSDGMWLGIILDEAKGRNNGSVEGTRYFKCPRNHGVFVRPCQIIKESVDDVNDKQGPGRIMNYPNYLNGSSKLKSAKRACVSKVTDIGKTKLKNADSQNLDAVQVQNTKENVPDRQRVNRENELLKTAEETLPKNLKAKEKTIPDCQEIKEENEMIKNKLKSTEESLQETIFKYTEATGEIKRLKDELDFKRKQIKIQKLNIKLLKMRQCNHYKKIGSYKAATKNNNASSTSDGQDISDDEFDLESMKALASMQRITELEEQNRIMIQGLVELREFLKHNCRSQAVDIDASTARAHRPVKSEIGDTNSLSEAQLKEYSEMLREMRKYSEIMKESTKLKTLEAQNLPSKDPSLSYERTQNKQTYGDNINTFHLNHHSSNTQEVPEILQNSTFTNVKEFQSYLQTCCNQSSNQDIKLASKTKSNYLISYVNNKVPSTSEQDPVDELRQILSGMVQQSIKPSMSNASLLKEGLVLEIRDFVPSSGSGKSEFDYMESQWALADHSSATAANSCGDSELPREISKMRTLPSARMYRRKEMGNQE